MVRPGAEDDLLQIPRQCDCRVLRACKDARRCYPARRITTGHQRCASCRHSDRHSRQAFAQPVTRRLLGARRGRGGGCSHRSRSAPAGMPHWAAGAPDRGRSVWMNLDQVELDAAYDQTFYAPLGTQDSGTGLRATVSWRASASGRHSVRRMAQPRSRSSISFAPSGPRRRSSCLFTAARGCTAAAKEYALCGRDLRQRRRPLRRARFYLGRRSERRPAA